MHCSVYGATVMLQQAGDAAIACRTACAKLSKLLVQHELSPKQLAAKLALITQDLLLMNMVFSTVSILFYAHTNHALQSSISQPRHSLQFMLFT